MSIQGSVGRQTNSYRQGLVLGLTMAEVFLLIVFALLIALASVWRSEQARRKLLDAQLEITGSITTSNLEDAKLLVDMRRLDRSKRVRLAAVVESLEKGESVMSLSEAETNFIEQTRSETRSQPAAEIDEHWRKLTSVTTKLDVAQIVTLIETGKEAERNGEHNWPPIINLSEAKGYFFASGHAELTDVFEQNLRDVIVPELLRLLVQYRADTIEVIGHTDEQPIVARLSNLDRALLDVLRRDSPVSGLIPGDNAGLGLARAVSVVHSLMLDGRLGRYRVLPLSAGQVIDTNEKVALGGGGDVRERRRIEIKVRRSQESVAGSAK
jgi:hypothetical protein